MSDWTYEDFVAAMTTLCTARGKDPDAGHNINEEVRALIPDIDQWAPMSGTDFPAIDVLRRAAYFEIAGNRLWMVYPGKARALLERGPTR